MAKLVSVGRLRRVPVGKHRTNLDHYLKSHGIKQSWLADKLGINKATMSRIANGATLPGLRLAQEIADILGTTVDELWPWNKEESD